MGRLLGHRHTKGAETDKPNLTLPRHISTLPAVADCWRSLNDCYTTQTCRLRMFPERQELAQVVSKRKHTPNRSSKPHWRLAKTSTVDCREQIVELNQNRYFDMYFFRIDYCGFDIAWISKLEPSSCSHCLHQWSYPQYFHHPFEIVREYMQAHFCTDMIQCFHLKMGRPHPCFERAKWMLNSLFSY